MPEHRQQDILPNQGSDTYQSLPPPRCPNEESQGKQSHERRKESSSLYVPSCEVEATKSPGQTVTRLVPPTYKLHA